jgi:hypothetical protein
MDADLHSVETLTAVGGALTADGILISLDRWPHTATKWWYTQCLEEAGMKVSLARSYLIETSNPGGVEHFPLTVARRAREHDLRTTLAEIISLASFKELSALNLHFEQDLAEALVRSIGPTEIMFEAVCEDTSGIRTLQLLKAPTLLLIYDFTNTGFRRAWIVPLVALPEALKRCDDLISEWEKHCTVTVRKKSLTEAAVSLLARLDYPTG